MSGNKEKTRLSACLPVSHPSSLHLFTHMFSSPLQDLLSTFSQLYQTCSSRIDWLEQEVSAHRGHVTALRSELQDVCLRETLAYVPVSLWLQHLDDFIVNFV